MSAADSVFKFGAGVKGLAIGAAILAAIGAAWWAFKKADRVAEGVKDAGGFLFGADGAPQTLGTWLHEKFNDPEPVDYDSQAAKTCAALYPPGSGKVPKPGGVCERLASAERLDAL